MKWIAAVLLAASPALFAQRSVSPTGFGRILFPGGTAPSGVSGAGRIVYPGTGAPAVQRPGFGGFPVYAGPPQRPRVNHGPHSTPFAVPFPVFYGGGYYDYDAPYAGTYAPAVGGTYATSAIVAQPTYAVPQPAYAPQQQPPVVIINQYFREERPVGVQGSAPPVQTQPQQSELAPRQDDLPVFLIAMLDHTVNSARAYWIEDGTLHYITLQGSENSVSMDLVDRELSRRLNRDRNVGFGLPEN